MVVVHHTCVRYWSLKCLLHLVGENLKTWRTSAPSSWNSVLDPFLTWPIDLRAPSKQTKNVCTYRKQGYIIGSHITSPKGVYKNVHTLVELHSSNADVLFGRGKEEEIHRVRSRLWTPKKCHHFGTNIINLFDAERGTSYALGSMCLGSFFNSYDVCDSRTWWTMIRHGEFVCFDSNTTRTKVSMAVSRRAHTHILQCCGVCSVCVRDGNVHQLSPSMQT